MKMVWPVDITAQLDLDASPNKNHLLLDDSYKGIKGCS